MTSRFTSSPCRATRRMRVAAAAASLLVGCASVGPTFHAPTIEAPASWNARASSARDLAADVTLAPSSEPRADWWVAFHDPVLDELQARALDANLDLRTAALHFAQARQQRSVVASQQGPQANASAQATRLRQSEHSAETRLVNAIGGANSQALVHLLSSPLSLYQTGFDVGWELDLWGRVRRSIESADATVDQAAAQLRAVRLLLVSELARAYFELRATQAQQALLERQTAITQDLLALRRAQARHGLTDEDAPLSQSESLLVLQTRLLALRVQQSALTNQISLLLGQEPGALSALLAPVTPPPGAGEADVLPELVAGAPSSLVQRRPDVEAAEARLHAATADIGVATADLYPRIALGASVGLQSIQASSFTDWGSRTWQVGPSLSLPLFDQGRRRATVELRRQQQQEAAVAWQKAVLVAWQEVDDALVRVGAERLTHGQLMQREAQAREQLDMARARARTGLTSELPVLQAEQAWLATRADLLDSRTRLQTAQVAVYKALGGGSSEKL